MSTTRRFHQVDVFTAQPLRGNALAVVHDAQGLSDEQMADFARWTNLSETTFLLPPSHAEADYRVRIFTPSGELPFAGHPTLGSCFAWLDAGGRAKQAGEVVQECGVGLVRVKRDGGRLAFAAPPTKVEPADPQLVQQLLSALGLQPAQLKSSAWLANGPRWLTLELDSAETVLKLKPDFGAIARLCDVGVVGRYPAGSECDVEIRFFVPQHGIPEDPVTGSLNASVACWMMADGRLPRHYVAAQGTCIGRAGRVYLDHDGHTIWVGGDVVPLVQGSVQL
jgi:PhzF family phenazine biosynthesis protein